MNPSLHRTDLPPRVMLQHDAALQRGIALIIGLIILAVLSLIGVAAFSVSTQEERMAGNSRDRIRAFEAAESALRDCENYASTNALFDGTDGSYTAPLAPLQPFTETINWSNPGTTVRKVPTASINNPEWSQQPICVIEQLQVQSKPIQLGSPVQATSIAHVTAQGYGTNPNTVVQLESYYAL
jgi:type IV pilus assembly protein PilX